MKKTLAILICLAMCLVFGGCEDTAAKQEKYVSHSGLSYVDDEEITVNYEDDHSGKVVLENLIFDFEIEDNMVYLVFDKLCDGLSEYENTVAKAERSNIKARRSQIEYEASILRLNGETTAAEEKLSTAKYDYKYMIIEDCWVNTEEKIDIFIDNSDGKFFNGRASLNNGTEFLFTDDGDFINTYLTGGPGKFKTTCYGTYEQKNGFVYITIDKTVKEIDENTSTELKNVIETLGYIKDGELFNDILVLKK